MQNVQPIELGRMRQHILQQVGPLEIHPAGSTVVVVARGGVREGLEDGERRLRVAQPEPGARAGLLVDAGVDVAEERRHELLLPRPRLQLDEVRLPARRVVDALHEPSRVLRVVLGPGGGGVGERGEVRCRCCAAGGAHGGVL